MPLVSGESWEQIGFNYDCVYVYVCVRVCVRVCARAIFQKHPVLMIPELFLRLAEIRNYVYVLAHKNDHANKRISQC